MIQIGIRFNWLRVPSFASASERIHSHLFPFGGPLASLATERTRIIIKGPTSLLTLLPHALIWPMGALMIITTTSTITTIIMIIIIIIIVSPSNALGSRPNGLAAGKPMLAPLCSRPRFAAPIYLGRRMPKESRSGATLSHVCPWERSMLLLLLLKLPFNFKN